GSRARVPAARTRRRRPMSRVAWSRVRPLLEQALDVDAPDRDRWLVDACAGDADLLVELRALVAAHAAPNPFGQGVGDLLAPLLARGDEPEIGGHIGPYRLLRELGSGGMGRVYLAERADGQFAQQVALKRMRGDGESVEIGRRFLRERETLARLKH